MMTEISDTIAGEGMLLLISLLQGIILMAAYDVLRIFRRMVRHGVFWLAFEDVIYWTGCSLAIFSMLYRENEGAMRWFVFAGTAIGMLMENHFISPWVIKAAVAVLSFFAKIIKKVVSILVKPCKKIKRKGSRVYQFLKKRLKKIGKAIKIGLCKL